MGVAHGWKTARQLGSGGRPGDVMRALHVDDSGRAMAQSAEAVALARDPSEGTESDERAQEWREALTIRARWQWQRVREARFDDGPQNRDKIGGD